MTTYLNRAESSNHPDLTRMSERALYVLTPQRWTSPESQCAIQTTTGLSRLFRSIHPPGFCSTGAKSASCFSGSRHNLKDFHELLWLNKTTNAGQVVDKTAWLLKNNRCQERCRKSEGRTNKLKAMGSDNHTRWTSIDTSDLAGVWQCYRTYHSAAKIPAITFEKSWLDYFGYFNALSAELVEC